MTFFQFKHALEHLKGGASGKEFQAFLGLNSLKVCLSKCKPFSKKNGASLPELPSLVAVKKKIRRGGTDRNLLKESRDVSVNKEVSKRINSSLVFPEDRRSSQRRQSLFCRDSNQNSRGRFREIGKSPSGKIISSYKRKDIIELFA
jgi:hypothetical protein